MTRSPGNQTRRSFLDSLIAVRTAYVERLADKVAMLRTCLESVERGEIDAALIGQLRQQAHELAGSGATFGFPSISETATAIDRRLSPAGQDDGHTKPDDMAAWLAPALRKLIEACEAAPTQTPATSAPAAAPPEKPGFNILLADDDPSITGLLQARLEAEGFTVWVADNGRDALALAREKRPDLIVLDRIMPGLDGLEVLKQLKADGDMAALRVIMLTAQRAEQEVTAGIMAGAIDYIAKPFDPEAVAARIVRLRQIMHKNIVIADNDPLVLQLLRQKFEQKGMHVRLAEDGLKAWEMIRSSRPDLVILDRMMPGLDGMSVLHKMRSDPQTQAIPVILLTARKAHTDVVEGLKQGAQDYVTKPFIPEELMARCLRLLEDREER